MGLLLTLGLSVAPKMALDHAEGAPPPPPRGGMADDVDDDERKPMPPAPDDEFETRPSALILALLAAILASRSLS